MRFRHYITGIIIFLLLGEVILRIDQKITPFAQDDHIFLAVKLTETPELKMAAANSVPLDDSTFRVMVLGDSYINGWGTDENRKFSNLLRKNLTNSASGRYKRFLVLDISKPGNNTLDNYNEYRQYYASFKPQTIILPYNINDVEDNLDEVRNTADNNNKQEHKHINKPNFGKKLYDIIYQVHLVQYLLHNFHSYLKGQGIVIPNSELDNQLKSYTQNIENWVKSKRILNKMIREIGEKKEKLVVILMPEYNVINNLSAFNPTYTIISQFFTGHPNTTFINPVKYCIH